MEEILFKWIPSVGFPIVVAVYVLVRIEPRLNALNTIINTLIPIIQQDSDNTKGVKDAIESLRLEIARLNGKK